MFNKEVTDQDGQKHMVYASTESELATAVDSVENLNKPTYPNINHPVAKGHDLLETQDDGSTKLVDGTGAHNSPNDAVQSDGKTDDGTPVLGMDEPEYKTQGDPGNVRDREADAQRNREATAERERSKAPTTEPSDEKSEDVKSPKA